MNRPTASVLTTDSARLGTTAIIVAHPGHELRVFRWMEESRPLYCCITEGSGGNGSSRMASTTTVLQMVGATPGPIFGRYSDKEVYRLLLEGDVGSFVQLASEIAEFLIDAGVSHVAGDAVEGFNPTHDVCRFVVDGAVGIVRTRTGRIVRNDDFIVDGNPDSCPDSIRSHVTRLELDDAALQRKIDAALTYPELREEVRLALERFGRKAFAVEYLRPSTTGLMLEKFEHELPRYERYGRIRVNEGRYADTIRYHEHVLPVRKAIAEAILA